MNALKRLFRLPTPREYAERKLEEHQRELIEARRISQSQSHIIDCETDLIDTV